MQPKVLVKIITIIASLTNVTAAQEEEEFCTLESSKCSSENSNENDPKWNQFMNQYHEALEKFKPCETLKNDPLQCHYKQVVDQDLEPFPHITQDLLEDARQVASHPVTYVNLNGTLYRSASECLFPARCDGVEYFLSKLSKKLPNFEIVINNNDWPFVNKRFVSKPVPLFSFSKTGDYSDIFYPAWTFWAGGPAISKYPKGLGRWDLMRKTLLLSSQKWPWPDKEAVAFFRGSRTSSQRDNLILLSRTRPDLVDAAYTKNQAWKSKADTLGHDPASEVSLEDHCKYKYLFNFRGVAASFRFKHLFLCGSVVLHVGNEWQEFFYPALQPWIHYVPVKSDASIQDLQSLLAFLMQNEATISSQIAHNGREFVQNWLKMSNVEAYWTYLLTQYAGKMKFVPQLDFPHIKVTNK